MDKEAAVREIGFIGARLREKSTYAGLGVGLAFLFGLSNGHITIDPTALAGALEMIGMGAGSLCMILLPEKSVKSAIAFLIAGSLLAIGMPEARAGDINAPATKAPSFTLGEYPTLNGMIVGIYTEGGASSVNAQVPGVNSASLTTTQAALGVTLGYMLTPRNSNIAFSIEGDFCVQNFNGANVGLSLQDPLCAEQRVVAWAPWQTLLQMLPVAWNPFSSISAFSPPNGLAPVGGQLAGFGIGAYEKDISTAFAGVQTGKVWLAEPEIVFMTAQRYSNGGALRGWLKIGFPNQSRVIGALPIGATTASFNTPDFRVGLGAAF